MDPSVLTCLSLPSSFVLKELEDERIRNVRLNLPLLEKSIIALADVTWLWAVARGLRDVYACNVLYFAFRVLELGIQLARHGRIIDFKAANKWFLRACSVSESIQQRKFSIVQGFSLVHAAFEEEYEQEVRRFQSALGMEPGRKPVCQSKDFSRQSDNLQDGLGYCHLVNCGHRFRLEIIIDLIASADLQIDRTQHGYTKNPAVLCPTCSKSVVVAVPDWRKENRARVISRYSLEGTNTALHFPYEYILGEDGQYYLSDFAQYPMIEWTGQDEEFWENEVHDKQVERQETFEMSKDRRGIGREMQKSKKQARREHLEARDARIKADRCAKDRINQRGGRIKAGGNMADRAKAGKMLAAIAFSIGNPADDNQYDFSL
eukprot:gnl/MRDRNA2_/MRDRNA2_155169_c0_seq1.p1 gnl/MRDRNA2_/MRDRNA2_155169_c0~~gnl/MRDRNA2_/MRDRNA2_155169_c0_seq1.p1  ORF type:complete len:409 (+),score=68.83 gnl/MRDRNA2_/MRDRNA2_155169_c0_seq1:102-1229(+)